MPGLISGRFSDWDVFYSSYLQTYIDRDVSNLINLTDKPIFRDFIRAAACRIGQLLNIHDIAQDVGISDDTTKRWLQVLEKSDIIFYGALNGAIWGNYIVSKLLETYQNDGKECLLWYYRDKEMHEIDMSIESDGMLHPMEVKRSVNPGSGLIGTFDILNKGSVPKGKGA